MTQHYKSLKNGTAMHGGQATYDLPTMRHDGTWIPGAWMPRIRRVIPCLSGYHTWTWRDATRWLGPEIWRAEVRRTTNAEDKYVSGEIRLTSGTHWNDQTARLFAVQCAVDVLPLYEQNHPTDSRLSNALVVVWERVYGHAAINEWWIVDDIIQSTAGTVDRMVSCAVRAAISGTGCGALWVPHGTLSRPSGPPDRAPHGSPSNDCSAVG